MKNIWTIARRDFRAYFTSPIAYVVIALFLAIMGWMFFMYLSGYQLRNAQAFMGKSMSITEGIVQPVFSNMNVIFLFVLPFVTMRLFAEEKKLHTIELLMTSPVTTTQIVLGKFLSSLLFLLVMLGMTLVYPAVLFATGNPEIGPILSSYLGMFLLAGCILAIGTLCSALTENQIVAGVMTFAAVLFLWIVSWASQSAGPVWSDFLNYISLITHFINSFSHGVIATPDVAYYLSVIGFSLFLTHRVLDSYRWR